MIKVLNTRTKAIAAVLAITLIFADACSHRGQPERVQNPEPQPTATIPPANPGISSDQQVNTSQGTAQARLPQFSEYPAGPLFTGKPAIPTLTTKVQRMFRSHFRFDQHERPDFAGEYKIVRWGCGSPCLTFAIANLKTGVAYDPPFGAVGPDLRLSVGTDSDWGLEYKVDSRLLVVKGCPKEPCGTYYFDWNGGKLNLIRIIPNEPPNEEGEK